MKENKIHVAFGFHVNCYHSYRGDTNDNFGFGSDIRIIRQIIDVLNKCNEDGIPVKGTWDSENFFSLEQILPEYAPDIIEGMKERVKKYGDENIIMGYSNGALGAMNDEEFEASIELAVTNEQGSGLQDIFGEYEKIVRPQEVMFTPSQVSLYNKTGVKALCLYYSCVPFDAFRTIVPKLPDEIAFNPVKYTYKGESMTIIPTYSNSDVCDAGCLRGWVKELRAKQESDEINNDMFIFINMDADSVFWEPMSIPLLKGKIANTDGINGLVREIADLDYIVFDTPGGYIKNHAPIGEINFTQDTADGNFAGYASWAEKPYNRKIWTQIERARAMSKVNAESDFDSPSFKDRVLLLSTTHFGLATPVLNIQREKKADELAAKIIEEESSAIEKTAKLTLNNITKSDFQCIQLKVNADITDASQIKLTSKDLKDFAIIPMDDELGSVFAMMKFKSVKDKYEIGVSLVEPKLTPDADYAIKTDNLEMRFSVHGNLYAVYANGKKIGDETFLKGFITYDKTEYGFENVTASPLTLGGSGKGIRVSGIINLPNQTEQGNFTFDFFTMDSSDAIFVKSTVNYPYTPETTSISTENSSLGRFSDMNWKEAVPFQITPKFEGDISVIKRNYMGDISSFRTQCFPECDEKNKKVYSFNHQLTAGLVGLTDGETGIAIANARQVLNSMAHCPMRLDEDKTVHMSPFGTFYGPQRHHWGRANDEILATYTLVTPQGKSLAPAYNGNSETALMGIYAFSGAQPVGEQLEEILAFADGCVATDNDEGILTPFYDDNVKFKEAKADSIDESKLKNPIMTGFAGNFKNYVTKGSKAIRHIIKAQRKARK
ncbi:MAG: glycosyl hydrolase family 57 [Ruminococcaceae bacterium]|nr:glycosyl hydrolase family 57 [Oscillospiraceae bacterium]